MVWKKGNYKQTIIGVGAERAHRVRGAWRMCYFEQFFFVTLGERVVGLELRLRQLGMARSCIGVYCHTTSAVEGFFSVPAAGKRN